MTITRVQKNGSSNAAAANATPPAWGSTTTAGNLLLVIVNEQAAASASAWASGLSGYTAVFANSVNYNNFSTFGNYAIFWKIAAGSDATPGTVGRGSGSVTYTTYTYEFASPGGWLTTPIDGEAHSAASGTTVTTKASGATATLLQANELALGVLAINGNSSTGFAFTNSYVIDLPTTNNAGLQVAWVELSSTTATSTTPTWTTADRAGCRVATFMPTAAATARPTQRVVRIVGAGR